MMNYGQLITSWWLKQQKKTALITLLIVFLSGLSFFLFFLWKVPYEPLFRNLSPNNAHKIIAELEKEQINYQVADGGRALLIAKDKVAKMRLKILGNEFTFVNKPGFEIFDKSDFGITDFTQKINYQRALEGELERTIMAIAAVKRARVHLVLPEQHFLSTENTPSAAVSLHLQQPLSRHQISGIRRLISASVSHLDMQKVVIIDNHGSILSDNNENSNEAHFTQKKQLEEYLCKKTMAILERIFPGKGVLVKIDVQLNFDQVRSENIHPDQKVVLTHSRVKQHHNSPPNTKTAALTEYSSDKEFQVGHQKEIYARANGQIERLSMSVILPANSSSLLRDKILHLCKTIVGFNEQRGDQISVEAVLTAPPKTEPLILIKKVPMHYSSLFIILPLMMLLTTGIILLPLRLKTKRRRNLLLEELNQWLVNHEHIKNDIK